MKVSGIMKSIANNKFILRQSEKIGNAGSYAAKFAVASVCLKDSINCYYYYTQSLNNEKIPEKKRKYVASLDLMNGVLNLAAQLTLGSVIASRRFQGVLTKKFIEKWQKPQNINRLYTDLTKIPALKGIEKTTFNKAFNGINAGCKGGIGVITALIGTTIIAKRMLVPLIATPAASWYKNTFLNDEHTPPKTEKHSHLNGQKAFAGYKYLENKKSQRGT